MVEAVLKLLQSIVGVRRYHKGAEPRTWFTAKLSPSSHLPETFHSTSCFLQRGSNLGRGNSIHTPWSMGPKGPTSAAPVAPAVLNFLVLPLPCIPRCPIPNKTPHVDKAFGAAAALEKEEVEVEEEDDDDDDDDDVEDDKTPCVPVVPVPVIVLSWLPVAPAPPPPPPDNWAAVVVSAALVLIDDDDDNIEEDDPSPSPFQIPLPLLLSLTADEEDDGVDKTDVVTQRTSCSLVDDGIEAAGALVRIAIGSEAGWDNCSRNEKGGEFHGGDDGGGFLIGLQSGSRDAQREPDASAVLFT
ncbi:hypothetical protein B0T17DRAFT_594318 [Bombardia bombarda]|uniref:Uncharacterized protein n=1 Tax=Bombardia bombarda TaxID=252184 RepID=A0AA39XI68_9PEZI|nr:hypothetical protein B0T17DRAFT_594318 [Bombardia bombarda]